MNRAIGPRSANSTQAYCGFFFGPHHLPRWNSGLDPTRTIVDDARRHGITCLQVDVNRSDLRCVIETNEKTDGIRLSLICVKGISLAKAQSIVNAREREPFKSLRDFVAQTKLDVANIENLIGVGAFDCFGLSRRQLMWQLWIADQWRGRELIDPKLTAPPLPKLSPWGKLTWEYSAQQFSIDAHPMELLRSKLHSEVRRQDALRKLRNGVRTGVAGLVVCIQKPATANGVSFMTLEDESGLLNVVISPDIYAKYRSIFKLSPFVYVYGILQREGELISFQAQSFRSLRTEFA